MIKANDIYRVGIIWTAEDDFLLDTITAHVISAYNILPADIHYTSNNKKAYMYIYFTDYKQSNDIMSYQEFIAAANSIPYAIQIIFENNFNDPKIDGRYPLNPEFADEFNKPEYHVYEINQ